MTKVPPHVPAGITLGQWPDEPVTGFDAYAAREKMGVTQEQMADHLDVHRNTYAKWEAGGAEFKIPRRLAAWEILGILKIPMKHIRYDGESRVRRARQPDHPHKLQ